MTKKQRQEIAKIWAGSVLLNFGIDSFGKDVLNEDAGAIVQHGSSNWQKYIKG